jgi:hypothetical protein
VVNLDLDDALLDELVVWLSVSVANAMVVLVEERRIAALRGTGGLAPVPL